LRECGANTIVIVVDVVAIGVDIAISIDVSGVIGIITRGPQQPNLPLQSNPRFKTCLSL